MPTLQSADEQNVKQDDIKRILILRPDGIGDVINTTPAISAIRQAYQNAHIDIVARSPGSEILKLNPYIDDILTYDPKGLHKSLKSKAGFIKRLRLSLYDMAIAFRDSSECNLIAYLSGARYRIGRKSSGRMFSFTLTDGVDHCDPKGTKHEIDRNMEIAAIAGGEKGEYDLILRLSEDERNFATDFIKSNDLASESPGRFALVGIHPGGSSYDKLWNAESFAAIANRLIRKFDSKIILFNGLGEEHLGDSIKSMMIYPPVLARQLRLRHVASLIERCSLFICNDSGPMHIAAALKIPTIAIFGPTDYIRWKPYNKSAIIVKKDMDCWPCSAHKCKKSFECIKTLPVDNVWNAIEELHT